MSPLTLLRPPSPPLNTGRTWHTADLQLIEIALQAESLSIDPPTSDVNQTVRAQLVRALLEEWRGRQDELTQLIGGSANQVAEELRSVDRVFNLKWEFSQPFAASVLADLLNVDVSLVHDLRPHFSGTLQGDSSSAATELRGVSRFLRGHLSDESPFQGPDLFRRVAATMPDIPRPSLVGNMSWLFLGLGWDLCHGVITNTVIRLSHGSQIRVSDNDLPEIVNDAFRTFDPSPTLRGERAGIPHYVVADTRLADVELRRNDIVLLDVGAANRSFVSATGEPVGEYPTIAWEEPGVVFPCLVLPKPEVRAALVSLLGGGCGLEIVTNPDTVGERLADQLRLRAEGLDVRMC